MNFCEPISLLKYKLTVVGIFVDTSAQKETGKWTWVIRGYFIGLNLSCQFKNIVSKLCEGM